MYDERAHDLRTDSKNNIISYGIRTRNRDMRSLTPDQLRYSERDSYAGYVVCARA